MKTFTTSIIFLVLFLGFQMQANAQASASVSYTIVVTEDMLANVNPEPRGFGFDFDNTEKGSRQEAVSNVSVSLQSTNTFDNTSEIACFETEMSTSDPSSIHGMISAQFNNEVAEVITENHTNENGQYMVVIEYN